MSLASWKAEFYPIAADSVLNGIPESTQDLIKLTKHSLVKWRGLTTENLRKHDVVCEGSMLTDDYDDALSISDSSCSLCHNFMNRFSKCNDCPLFMTLNTRCDDGPESPWHHWIVRVDPQPMIKALEETLENLEVQLEDERIQERIKHEEEEEANKS